MEVCETTKISLDLFLKKDETESVAMEDYEKMAYYSSDENSLYILKGVSHLSGDVAKEVSRIFKGAEREAFPFLNSALAQAGNEEALAKQLALFGINEEETPYQEPGKVELITDPMKTAFTSLKESVTYPAMWLKRSHEYSRG